MQLWHKHLPLLIIGLFLVLSPATAQKADKAVFQMNSELMARDSGDFTIYSLPGSSSVKLMVAKDQVSTLADPGTTGAATGPVAKSSAVPSCTTPVSPSNGQINVCPAGFILEWAPVPGATGYKVFLSGNPNQNPLPLWGTTSGTTFGPVFTGFGVVERWTIVPFNDMGDAVGCPIWSFTCGDNTPPSITCPANTTIVADPDCSGSFGAFSPLSFGDNCRIAAESNAVTQIPASGTLTGVGSSETIQLFAKDFAGNSASCTFTVTLVDQTPPTATTQNYTAILNSSGSAVVLPTDVFVQGADNCGTATPLSVNPAVFSCADLGPNTVTLTVGDGNGNDANFSATVTVVASALPAVSISSSDPDNEICGGTSVNFTAMPTNGGTTPQYEWTINGIVQSETGPTMERSNLADGDAVQVALTSSDPCLATPTAVSDPISMIVNTPALDAGDAQQVYLGYGSNCTTLTATGLGDLSYSWSPGGMTEATITVCPTVTTTYLVTATDDYGCTATDGVVVNVQDVRCGNNNDKVIVCHDGNEICIAANAVAAHLAHGDVLGTCDNSGVGLKSYATETIERPEQLFLSASPNPTLGIVTVELLSPAAGRGTFQVFDLMGRERQTRSQDLVEGWNEVLFQLGDLPTGTYLIRAVDALNRQTTVWVVKSE